MTKLSFFTHSLEEIKKEALNFKYRSDFQKAHPGVYTTLSNRKLINEVCSHMVKKPKCASIEEDLIELKKYSSRKELLEKNKTLYYRALRRNLQLPAHQERMFKSKVKIQKINFNYKMAQALIPKFKSLTEFSRSESSLKWWLIKNNLYHKFAKEFNNYHKLSDEEIIKIAGKFKTKTELKYYKHPELNLWYEIKKRKLEKKALAHMNNGYTKRWDEEYQNEGIKASDEEIYTDCLNYPNLSAWRLFSPALYRQAKNRGIIENCKRKHRKVYKTRQQVIPLCYEKNVLHPEIIKHLNKLNIEYNHELTLAINCRPDFTIKINKKIYILEIKSEKSKTPVLDINSQISRYTQEGEKIYKSNFGGVILVSDKPSHKVLNSVSFKDLPSVLKSLLQENELSQQQAA